MTVQLPTFFDMVNVNVSGSPGTGNMTLGSALVGFQAATVIPNNTWVSYRATDGTNWETAHGNITISAGVATLASRGTDTLVSSNSNSLVNFGSGVTVIICPTSQDINAFVSALATQGFTAAQQTIAQKNIGLNFNITSPGIGTNVSITCTAAGNFYMAGLALSFTPSSTGICFISGSAITLGGTANTGDSIFTTVNFGTGTAPANGVIEAGTQFEVISNFLFEPQYSRNFATFCAAVKLTSGTAYWIDLGVNNNSSASTLITVEMESWHVLEF